jgi:hypothetical protein
VSALQVDFPLPWAVLPTDAGSTETTAALVAGMGELSPEAGAATAEYFGALVPALRGLGIDGFASLVVPDEENDSLVQAFCAVGTVAAGADLLREIAEAGLHPGLERETADVELPIGAAVRSSAVRLAEELADDEGWAPWAAEVRYAVPLGDDQVAVLHFETMSLVYREELENLFDAIAGSARRA